MNRVHLTIPGPAGFRQRCGTCGLVYLRNKISDQAVKQTCPGRKTWGRAYRNYAEYKRMNPL